MAVRVRGVVLPERAERSFWIDGGLLREDGPTGADLVAYDSDPAADPAVLRRPARIILRGRILR